MRHMKSGNQIRTFMFAAVTILFAKALTAGNALDSVIAMDSSGSMKKTDPEELRKPAAKLFINLLNDDDQLSVISFSEEAHPITILSRLNTETNKNRALRAADKTSSNGAYTNIYAAIKKAIEFLRTSHSMNRQPIILLLSDGKNDVGATDLSQELNDKIKTELVPELIKYKIKIYSIAFTSDSDQTLLQEIADATNGHYALAENDEVLHKIFARMFELSKEPNMLPLSENQFIADESIREITIIANKTDQSSQIFLQPPNGDHISASTKSDNIEWFVSPGFDMITIRKPEPGEWSILFSNNDNKAYIVADIQLRSHFEYQKESGHEATITTWFIKDDSTITNIELLESLDLKVEIETPDKTIIEKDFNQQKEAGVFITNFTPSMNGIHTATVMAQSRTFQRQQFFSFVARNHTLTKLGANLSPSITTATEKKTENEPANPEIEQEPNPATKIKADTNQEQSPASTIPENDADTLPDSETTNNDFIDDLLLFIGVNIAIIFILLNVFFIFKFIKNKNPEDNSAE